MRVLLLTNNKETAGAYRRAAEEEGLIRLAVVRDLPQALECMFRMPFDALISEDSAVFLPAIQKRPVLWPDNLFLLLRDPLKSIRIPERLTYCFLCDSSPSDVLAFVNTFPNGQRRINAGEVRISRFLQRIGVPVSMYGFSYLKEAIDLLLQQTRMTDIPSLSDVYGILSDAEGVGPTVIEHAMRHAINTAWIRAETHTLERVFGYTVDADRAAPSNAAFLFRAADYITITQGEE